jgi:hypothetical protein
VYEVAVALELLLFAITRFKRSVNPIFFNGSSSPFRALASYFSQTVGLLGGVISSSQGRYIHTGQHKHRINACTQQTFMPCVGFEPTITASERAKTFHALDRAATVTGSVSPITNPNSVSSHLTRDSTFDVIFLSRQISLKFFCVNVKTVKSILTFS